MTCSQRSCVPKARTPRTWVTVLASQPSVSMETETTQRIDSPRRPCFADGVHDFAEQFLIGEVLGLLAVAGALDDLAAEAVDLVGGHVAEVVVQRSPDSSCSLSISRVRGRASGLPCSSKLRNSARRPFSSVVRAVFVLALEAGDVVVDQLGGGRVVADDDEAGRHPDAGFAATARTSFRSGRRGLPARSAVRREG